MNDDYKAIKREEREWRKLTMLRRAVLLSYLHTMLSIDQFEEMRYASKYEMIETIQAKGMADDCLLSFA